MKRKRMQLPSGDGIITVTQLGKAYRMLELRSFPAAGPASRYAIEQRKVANSITCNSLDLAQT